MPISTEIGLFVDFAIIMFFCLLPVFLITRSVKKAALAGFTLAIFIYIYRDFFLGKTTSYHDTFWDGEILFRIVRQWAHDRFYPGWDPYLNAGEPIYLFSNSFIKTPYILFSFLGEWINLASHTLFNHCFIFIFLNICVGFLLLFLSFFDDFKVAYFCFVCLLFSGCFDVNLGQVGGVTIVYFLPYILFGLITSFKKKAPQGIMIAILYLGISMNQYVPTCLFLILAIFIAALIFFYPDFIKVTGNIIRQNYKIIILGCLLALLAASPVIFLKSEFKNFAFPARGFFNQIGGVTAQETGLQVRVTAPFSGYRVLLDRFISYQGNTHHAFYFGIIPLLLIPLGLFISKNRIAWPLFITAALTALIGDGSHRVLSFLYKIVPTFNLVRHTYFFAQFVPFFLICISGFGLKALLSSDAKLNVRIMLLSIIAAVLFILVSKSFLTYLLVLGGILAILSTIILSGLSKNRPKYRQLAYLPLFLLLALDLFIFNSECLTYTDNFRYFHYLTAPAKDLPDPAPVVYPSERRLFLSSTFPNPPDLYPLYFKQAGLDNMYDGFVFFRYTRLNDMIYSLRHLSIKESVALGAGRRIIYFTNNGEMFGQGVRKSDMIMRIFDDFSREETAKSPKAFFQEKEIDFNLYDTHGKHVYLDGFKMSEMNNPNRMSLDADMPVDGYLVRLENFDKGWKATVDGLPAKIYRANYAFQAIRIAAGKHRVVFEFKSIYPFLLSLYIGISILAWVLLNRYLYVYWFNRKFEKRKLI